MDSSTLPPLPRFTKEYNPYAADAPLNLPPVDATIPDDVLQNHLTMVQESILDSTDKKVQQIEAQLNEKDLQLKRSLDEKAATGVALYRSRKELGHLNKSLAAA